MVTVVNKNRINRKYTMNLLLIILSYSIFFFLVFLIESPITSLSHNFQNHSYNFLEVIIIYKDFIIKNIHRLRLQDVENFANKHKIVYTKDEALIIYQFIQYHYRDLLDENIHVFEEMKGKISPVLYQKLLTMYIEYKQKYL